MSKENVEIVRRVFKATADRDSDALLALYDLEVEWHVSEDLPMRQMFGSDVRVVWFPTRAEALKVAGLAE